MNIQLETLFTLHIIVNYLSRLMFFPQIAKEGTATKEESPSAPVHTLHPFTLHYSNTLIFSLSIFAIQTLCLPILKGDLPFASTTLTFSFTPDAPHFNHLQLKPLTLILRSCFISIYLS